MPTAAQPKARGRAAGVVDLLRDAMMAGRYLPGQRLVETELTHEYGVSRGPVREALRLLAAERLVELVPHRGALVRRPTATETREIVEILTELEAFAVRRAAGAPDPARLEVFRTAAALSPDTAALTHEERLVEDLRFHAAIVAAAGNGELVALHRQLQHMAVMGRRGSGPRDAEAWSRSFADHRAIADAILSQEPASAEGLLRAHLAAVIG